MISRRMLLLAAVLGPPLAAFCQTAVPVPKDPLEMVTGDAHLVEAPDARQAAIQMLNKARTSQLTRVGRHGYDLKVSFTVDSGGKTKYDGAWEMEEIFNPDHGLRWTAKAAAGFSATAVSAGALNFGQGTEDGIPLRLEEARAALFGAIPTNADRDTIRTATGTYSGIEVTCFLLSGAETVPTLGAGRRWDETEECIDPQSGLLQIHSQIPGRFYAYDYTDAPKLADRTMPSKVIVSEAGKTVVQIHVDSWLPLTDVDASLFTPTKEMSWTTLAGAAQKAFVYAGKGAIPKGASIQPVAIYGLVTASGDLVEAQSMQPADPNSQAALDFVKTMSFRSAQAVNGVPEQHLEYIIAKFVAPAAKGR